MSKVLSENRSMLGSLVVVLFLLLLSLNEAALAQEQGLLSYSVKFVCGAAKDESKRATVRPGLYATEINIHNYHLQKQVPVRKRVFLLVRNGKAVGREPEFVDVSGHDSIVLPPQTATLDDCQRIGELTGVDIGVLAIGYLQLISSGDLAVDAVYTSNSWNHFETAPSIDVERVEARRIGP